MNSIKNITVSQVIETLNNLVSPLNGTRITNFSDFHNEVDNLTSEYLKSIGIKSGLWHLKPKVSDDSPLHRIEVLQYSIPNFREDKRDTWNKKGRLDKVIFSTKYPIPGASGLTLEEYFYEIEKEEAKKALEGAKESVKKAEKELADWKAYQKECEAKYKTFKK